MLEVSAPRNLAFDAVWSSIGHWLKYHAEHEWSEENLEFVRKAVSRASTICLLRMVKDKDVTIVPVANEEEAKNLSDACDQGTYFFDIGGGLRELKNQLDAGAVHEAQQVQFRGPYDLEHDIGHGIKIRLCNSIFAAEYSAGK